MTANGTRELTVGDSLVFLENSLGKRGLGVLNGDRGEVVSVRHDKIAVRMYGAQKMIEFSPRSYKAWEHAGAISVHKSQGASVSACTAVIDRAASAELAFVAMSRSQKTLSLVVAKSNFASLDELAEHIASRISLKTTTRHHEEIVERTGGKQTVRVRNIEDQREAGNSPLRKMYDAEIREPAMHVRRQRIAELRAQYRARKHKIGGDVLLTLAQRLDAEKGALSEFRSDAARLYTETQPQPYLAWLDERASAQHRMQMMNTRREKERKGAFSRPRTTAQKETMEINYEFSR